MSADFWAGYISGAASIIIGNPLDLIKTRLQAGPAATESIAATDQQPRSWRSHFDRAGTLVRGATAPILTYGALNAILFVTYNRTLSLLSADAPSSPTTNGFKIWTAGAVGGLATFIVSAPTELVKCRAQVYRSLDPLGAAGSGGAGGGGGGISSWSVAKDCWKRDGLRGFYHGGVVTSVRDAVGYGFYFWSYELSKRALTTPDETDTQAALKVLFCGGLAGIVTWASIFPLDVIKTRVQTQQHPHHHLPPPPPSITVTPPPAAEPHTPLLLSPAPAGTSAAPASPPRPLTALQIAQHTYATEGPRAFVRGLGVCSLRAFVVNAVQWAVYEYVFGWLGGGRG